MCQGCHLWWFTIKFPQFIIGWSDPIISRVPKNKKLLNLSLAHDIFLLIFYSEFRRWGWRRHTWRSILIFLKWSWNSNFYSRMCETPVTEHRKNLAYNLSTPSSFQSSTCIKMYEFYAWSHQRGLSCIVFNIRKIFR